MTPLFQTRNLTKLYRPGRSNEVRAVVDVSLSIAEAEWVVLTGPSGSGKTTLLSLLGALERPTRGELWFHGRELSRCADVELARVRRRLGFVFQDMSLLPRLSLVDNITYPLIPRGGTAHQRRKTALALLDRLGMQDLADKHPEELSGGEQQRVAIARALAGDPEAILADEPTSNLDPAAGREVIQLFCDLHAAGKTVIVSSHDPQFIALATQTFRLEAGRLLTSEASSQGQLP